MARMLWMIAGMLLLGLRADAAQGAGEAREGRTRAYLVLFSYNDRGGNLPHLSHSFATFVRVPGSHGRDRRFDAVTISWMPASGKVRLIAPPEKGVNLSMEKTIRGAVSRGLLVSRWGPFEIHPELYERAERRARWLESGQPKYKCLDQETRRWAFNCIHAIADMDMSYGLRRTGLARGDEATLELARHLERWFEPVGGAYYESHPEVARLLELHRYPLLERRLSRRAVVPAR